MLTLEAFEDVKFNIDVSIARNGEEAIDFLLKKGRFIHDRTPELILLDINLPRKNGIEVLEFIKSNELLMQIPVIMLTTSSSEKDIGNCYKNHANCFITKPMGIDEFSKSIHEIENFWFRLAKLPQNNSK